MPASVFSATNAPVLCRLSLTSILVCAVFRADSQPAVAAEVDTLSISPQKLDLSGRQDRVQLVLANAAGQDVTRDAAISMEPVGIVDVDARGRVTPLKDGTATLTIRAPRMLSVS